MINAEMKSARAFQVSCLIHSWPRALVYYGHDVVHCTPIRRASCWTGRSSAQMN